MGELHEKYSKLIDDGMSEVKSIIKNSLEAILDAIAISVWRLLAESKIYLGIDTPGCYQSLKETESRRSEELRAAIILHSYF